MVEIVRVVGVAGTSLQFKVQGSTGLTKAVIDYIDIKEPNREFQLLLRSSNSFRASTTIKALTASWPKALLI